MDWTDTTQSREPPAVAHSLNYLLHFARRDRPFVVVARATLCISEEVLSYTKLRNTELDIVMYRTASLTGVVWRQDGVDLILSRVDLRRGTEDRVVRDYMMPMPCSPMEFLQLPGPGRPPHPTHGLPQYFPDPVNAPYPPPRDSLRRVWINFETGEVT